MPVEQHITADDPPDYLAVSFDTGKTFRDEMYSEYKGTREKMPDELSLQIDRIREVVQAFSIPILEAEGYEADDVLGTVARLAEEARVQTLIVTGDRDLLQLVTEQTHVQLPGRRQGEDKTYDPEAVRERYGLGNCFRTRTPDHGLVFSPALSKERDYHCTAVS